MIKKHILRAALLIIAFTAFLYLLGFIFFWHWSIWWFDELLHFLAGIFLGLISIFFFLRYFNVNKLPDWQWMIIGVLGALILGLGWELFQFIVNQYVIKTTDWTDSFKDLYFDVLGGSVGAIYFLIYKKQNEE